MRSRKALASLGAACLVAAVAIATTVPSVTDADAHGQSFSRGEAQRTDAWYRVLLEKGEVNGYRWAVGASGPRDEPLKQMCELVSEVAPFDPDLEYAEGGEMKLCGELLSPAESISVGLDLGSSESSTTLRATIYRPIVRKVVFVRGTGDRKVYRTKAPRIAGRKAKGIPRFRYLAALFDEESCIQRIITYDPSGAVIKNEKAEPGCT